jgi:hypothetical protein
MLSMLLVFSLAPVCSKTSIFASSANFASKIVEFGGKDRVDTAYAEMSFGKVDIAGAWVRRWMCRVDGEEGGVRAM